MDTPHWQNRVDNEHTAARSAVLTAVGHALTVAFVQGAPCEFHVMGATRDYERGLAAMSRDLRKAGALWAADVCYAAHVALSAGRLVRKEGEEACIAKTALLWACAADITKLIPAVASGTVVVSYYGADTPGLVAARIVRDTGTSLDLVGLVDGVEISIPLVNGRIPFSAGVTLIEF